MGSKVECPVVMKKATFIWDNYTISVSVLPNLEGIKHAIITYVTIKGNELKYFSPAGKQLLTISCVFDPFE